MKIFKISQESNIIHELTVTNFENLTHKREPYFIKEEKMKYYAVCPSCNNPIQIINLYPQKKIGNEKSKPLYAKHYSKDIKNLAKYDQEKYNNCPLKSPISFSDNTKQKNKNKSNEILSLIKNYPEILLMCIRTITKINFSNNKFIDMIDKFIKSEGYYYKYINKFNLPYAFLNMQNNINLYYLKPEELFTEKFKKILESKSKFFELSNSNQFVKKESIQEYASLEVYTSNHSIKNSEETLKIIIVEIKGKEKYILDSQKVSIDKFKFIDLTSNDSNYLKDYSLRKMVDKYIIF